MTGGDVLNLALGAITALSGATSILFAWGKSQVEKARQTLEERVVALEAEVKDKDKEIRTERDARLEALNEEKTARLSDAREYAEGIIRLSHRFRETMHTVVARLTQRR